MIDDICYYASDMDELEDNIKDLLKQCIPDMEKAVSTNKEGLFQQILVYLNMNMEKNISLGGICRTFGLSQSSLSRMFRIYQGESFSNYLTKIRIEKAKEIMKKSPDSYVKDVAERVGYSDQFYFSRIFRSVTGVCPKDFIEQHIEKTGIV